MSDPDRFWLARAVELAHRCPVADDAYAVGALVVAADGTELAHGYSRESGPKVHAEQSALSKLDSEDPRLPGATIYTSLEPCSRRASAPVPCARLIIESGIRRVVLAWREPPLFVADCTGAELLAEAGLTVLELPELADAARRPNAHLPLP